MQKGPAPTYCKDEMIKLYHALNGNHRLVSLVLGCSRERVRQVLTPMGLKATGNPHPEIIEKAKKLAENFGNLTRKEICETFKLSDRKLRTIQKYTDVEIKHGNVKYTNEQLIEAYNNSNGNYSKAAELLNMHQPCYSRVMKDRKLNELYPSKGRSHAKMS